MIWAIILAAGESQRMGTQKLLLPFGETTVVEVVVRTALVSSVDRVLAVLGADRDAVRLKLESSGAEFVINENYHLGMLSSVQAGFRALPADAEAGGAGGARKYRRASPAGRYSPWPRAA